ncbi:MAG: hypothetical protein P4L54_01110 [Acidocella sp.]|nr:hypothetical protein [Acidocella sp.]
MIRVSDRLWRWHAAALLIYAACAVIYIDHGQSLFAKISGSGSDPFIFIWDFAWWPWAIAHHQNLLHTNLMWQPLGVYLGWITSIPLLAIVGSPLTMLFGPVFSYNFFIICAPVLSAWVAYFLCLKITQSPLAALFGGYLFGFSTYEMAQETAALNLNFTAFVPALLLVIIMRQRDELTRWQVALLAGLILAAQFFISIEIFALVFVFGAVVWLFAMLYLAHERAKLRRLVVDAFASAPLTIVLVAPFLVSMLDHFSYVHLPDVWPYYFTIDFLNIFLPGHINLIGGSWFHWLSKHYFDDFQEQDGYIGIPLLIILYMFFRKNTAIGMPRFLLVTLIALILFSFGPQLWFGGVYTKLGLPWALIMKLPLLSSALPCRFFLFVSLLVAVIAALWVAQTLRTGRRNFAIIMGLLACVALLPSYHGWMNIPDAKFFAPGRVTSVLGPETQILIIPSGINGPSSYWQAESDFSFHQTGGYLGFAPAPMQPYQAVQDFYLLGMNTDHLNALKLYCWKTRTQYIVIGPGTPPEVSVGLAGLDWPMRKIDDVTIITVPPQQS